MKEKDMAFISVVVDKNSLLGRISRLQEAAHDLHAMARELAFDLMEQEEHPLEGVDAQD